MKKKLIYLLSSMFFFLNVIPVMAQTDPGADPDAVPPAPIDQYVWVLALIGIVYTLIKLNKVRTIQKIKLVKN
ncbi:MAG TPA: hypothetical protein PLO52_13240 [Flavobacterium alvei]|mgnify:CR=1 FL=1|nr:hypothetical protein [Flavobacterium alvei]